MRLKTTSESIHTIKHLKSNDLFLQIGKPCIEIGMLKKGVMRGFVYDNDGNEITTHFYQEDDMIIGSYIPKTNVAMTVGSIRRL